MQTTPRTKPRPNLQRYYAALDAMPLARALEVACSLADDAVALRKMGIRMEHPGLSEAEVHRLFIEERTRCRSSSC
jgi:hypothetical protein